MYSYLMIRNNHTCIQLLGIFYGVANISIRYQIIQYPHPSLIVLFKSSVAGLQQFIDDVNSPVSYKISSQWNQSKKNLSLIYQQNQGIDRNNCGTAIRKKFDNFGDPVALRRRDILSVPIFETTNRILSPHFVHEEPRRCLYLNGFRPLNLSPFTRSNAITIAALHKLLAYYAV